MKLELFNLESITIYLSNDYLKQMNFNIKENVEKQFKKLFIKIKDIYNINMSGYYEVIVYVNDIYGMIIELEKDTDEYIKIFGDTVDMKITFKFDSSIYYELEDYMTFNIDNYNLYYYNDKFYLELSKIYRFSYSEYLKLLESSNIIYGKEICDLRSKIKKLNKE